MDLVWPECTTRCRSLQHALDVISVVTRGSEQQIKAFLSSYCCNATTLKDDYGRNALHIAASCGKKEVLDWLASKGVDLSVKDKESGWTAFHRSIFYGHIHCAFSLLKLGSNLHVQDKDGFSPLDLVMKDRPSHVVFQSSDPTEVFTWGNNINFTLGHGSQQSKHHPEVVDMFPRSGIYIKQMVLCKFHSVFLSQKGQLYTCGHGQGGRLGHGDELTCLVPRLVEGLTGHPCSQVAAAKDHTVVLTEDGFVYTFGLNTFHQLGILPPPSSCNIPRQVQAKTLKGKSVIGVTAGRFHTVLWSRDAVYTMGLNGGQLGYLVDPNGEKLVSSPRQVSALHHKDISISLVAASNGATVCVTDRGDLYLLTEYQCKKLASKQLNLKKVLVCGGYLDQKADTQHLKENGGQSVSILALDQAGRVFCWKSSSTSLKQCRWVYGRQVFMSDFALNKNEMLFITPEGEGFTGKWMCEKKNCTDKKGGLIFSLIVVFCSPAAHYVSGLAASYLLLLLALAIEPLLLIIQSTEVVGFVKGQEDIHAFIFFPTSPHSFKTNLLFEVPVVSSSIFAEDFGKLLEEVDELDNIHDVTFLVGSQTFPAHKYILSMKCDYFRKLFSSGDSNQADFQDLYHNGEDSAGHDLIVIEKVPPGLFTYILQFVYTDTCDMLVYGHKPRFVFKEKIEENQDNIISDFQKIHFHEDGKGKSAYEVYKNSQICANIDKKKGKTKPSKKSKYVSEETSPVKMLQNLAKRFGLSNLSSRLDGVRYENGAINVVNKKSGNKQRFNQKKCTSLCDVTMRSEDGKEFNCHKCVLCARLEYFHSMLGNPWIEASCCTALEMPVHSDVLQVIIEYIYTDEAPRVKESANVEFICNVLVMADQLLIIRLKEICEVTLTERLTLKNAAELLEFAALYNANQLKLSCFQFIGLNMAALLEARSLDVLSDDVLKDLADSYRKMIPAMDKRLLTPYLDGPDISTLETEDIESFMSIREDSFSEQATPETVFKKTKTKAKKKPRKRLDSSGGYNLSDIIQSPPSTGLFKSEKNNSVESLQDLLTSDSEGSFAGASSPRDLQSPDFTAAFSPEKKEAKNKVCNISTSISPPPVSGPAAKNVPKLTTSSPKAIPNSKPAPTTSPNWVTVSFSPISPPAMDLRKIMEIEENSQKFGATPKLSTGVQKPSIHGTKLSQKQRKMMAMSSKEIGSTESTVKSATVTNSKSTPKTWSSSVQSASEHKSFRDLLLEEQKSVISLNSLGNAGKKNLQAEETDPRRLARKPPEAVIQEAKLKCDVPQQDTSNPWLSSLSKNKSSVVPVTFTAIVEEEKQQEAALIRSREKPLALIQVEERAIQDLLVHYQAIDNPEEYITIERSPQGPMAAPMWNKH
ncbi:PREDICTED: inhibitor of Bruton tyrosine kinase [Nanorana parkeri]|uniref:inhibitor of Bruton tyrosine kinase n=1 Tax=Nanorana parkeri TaxID=125878 RepID=UPI000854270E|nr:PREDICTED: inhibitor of Bruton tyrosine kinase [Nanorana parkeri]